MPGKEQWQHINALFLKFKTTSRKAKWWKLKNCYCRTIKADVDFMLEMFRPWDKSGWGQHIGIDLNLLASAFRLQNFGFSLNHLASFTIWLSLLAACCGSNCLLMCAMKVLTVSWLLRITSQQHTQYQWSPLKLRTHLEPRQEINVMNYK